MIKRLNIKITARCFIATNGTVNEVNKINADIAIANMAGALPINCFYYSYCHLLVYYVYYFKEDI